MNLTDEDLQEIRSNYASLPEEEKEVVREFSRTEEALTIARVLGIRPSMFLQLVKETKRPKKAQIQGLGAPV